MQRQAKIGSEESLIGEKSTDPQESATEEFTGAGQGDNRIKNRDDNVVTEERLSIEIQQDKSEPETQKWNSSGRKRKSNSDREGSQRKRAKKLPRSPTPIPKFDRPIKSILKKPTQNNSERQDSEENVDTNSSQGFMKTF
ncbi:unnamed protein product, partial [Nesidiocoris tenuis]